MFQDGRSREAIPEPLNTILQFHLTDSISLTRVAANCKKVGPNLKQVITMNNG